MALCLTHAAAGYLVYEAARPAGRHSPALLATAVVLANAPDVDFVPGLVTGAPASFHRGVTHTLLAALVVGLAAAAVAWWRRQSPRGPLWWGAFAAAAYASHLLVDFLAVDAVAPHGARFLWPLSHEFYHAGLDWFDEILIDPRSRTGFVWSLLTPAALVAWAQEVVRLALVVAAVGVVRILARSRLPQFAE
ncbi:MAG TPA: metal-dependent hydrolase [Candidatus Limnocylindria bacterium]|nr:metal-dependent hydrolase [Candidatus Limnocylindria bacterium]